MSTPKPVMLVAGGVDPTRGGMETSVLEYALKLVARGVRVILAAPGDPGRAAGLVEHIRLPIGSRHRRAEQAPELLRAAEKLAAERRHEVIVHSMVPMRGAHVYMPRAGIYHYIFTHSAMSCETALSRRLHLIGLALNPKRQRLIRRQRAIIREPGGPMVGALSEFVRECVLEICGDVSARIRVVRNGVDVDRLRLPPGLREESRAGWRIPEGTTTFAMVAHNFRLKGVYPFIRALGELARRDPGRPFAGLIAGGGDTRRADRLIRALGIADRVRMLGAEREILRLYAAADVVVHPTFYDPASRVVLEAIALGIPIITTRWNGSGEFVADNEGGIILRDPREIGPFADALARYCDPAVRARARAAILRLDLRRQVSMDRHVAEMLDFYRDLGR